MTLIETAVGEAQAEDRFGDRVRSQADRAAQMFLAGRDLGQPDSLEAKRFIEDVLSPSYDGRTLIELLQNGHDAQPQEVTDGALRFILDLDEGPSGVLYVANSGDPISEANFESLCHVAMSSKRPDEAIGNKGIGFKSVLNLSDRPEVFSKATSESVTFDGFCFRFAFPADFADVAARIGPAEPELADDLRDNVAALKVPVPLSTVPERVAALAGEAVTVVRLPLRDASARERTRQQLDELAGSDVPLHLFLRRIAHIGLSVIKDGRETRTQLSRETHMLLDVPDLKAGRIRLQDGAEFVVLRRAVPETQVLDAIRESVDSGRMPASWLGWRGASEVAIALPLTSELPSGRLFTFLPMAPSAIAPMHAFVNAPFFPDVDRRDLQQDVPLNTMWLTEVARLCAHALQFADAGELQLPLTCCTDLICWSPQALPGLQEALRQRGGELTELRLLPALETTTTSLGHGRFWAGPQGKEFTAQSVAACGAAEIFDPQLSSTRRGRLSAIGRVVSPRVHPSPADLATFAVAVAADMASRDCSVEQWAQFYDDLSGHREIERYLAGQPLLAGEQGTLLRANGSKTPVTVFFAPDADDEAIDGGKTPPLVLGKLAFLRDLPFLDNKGRRRPGRNWLESHALVREYRTGAVLGLLGQVMRNADPASAELAGVLEYAFRIWTGATGVRPEVTRAAGLLVPTRGGWVSATIAVFGPGWSSSHQDTDTVLGRLLTAAKDVSEDLAHLHRRTLVDPKAVSPAAAAAPRQWADFLEALGVAHGLMPRSRSGNDFRMPGSQVNDPEHAGSFWALIPKGDREGWQAFTSQHRQGTVSYPTRDYGPAEEVAVLPGQWDWDRLTERSQADYAQLVVTGLTTWPESVLRMRFTRSTDYESATWPSPVAYFLHSRAWVPQTTPGNRTEVRLVTPAHSWWVADTDTPDFLPAQPAPLRRRANPLALNRLRAIGVRVWDDPSSASARLNELAQLVGQRTPESRSVLAPAMRKANESAWHDLVEERLNPPDRVVVSRGGEFDIVHLGDEPIYVPDSAGVSREAVLARSSVALLPLKNLPLAERVVTAHGPTYHLMRASTAQVRLVLDGELAEAAAARRLRDLTPGWLGTLVLAVMEFKHRGFPAVGTNDLRRAASRLTDADITVGQSLIMIVEDHPVETLPGTDSFLLRTDDVDRLIVGGSPSSDDLPYAAAAGLCDLIGVPGLADSLRLALLELRHRGVVDATHSDIAAAIGVPVDDLDELMRLVEGGTSDWSAVVTTLALVEPSIAQALQDEATTLSSATEVHAWLQSRLAGTTWTPAEILAASEQRDLHTTVELLNVTLAQANAGLRELGLAPLHNADGHRRQMLAYTTAHRSRLHDRIRDRFWTKSPDPEHLQAYLRIREQPGPTPDPAWLDQFWDVPDHALAQRIEDWLQKSTPNQDPHNQPPHLDSVDTLRDRGRHAVSTVLSTARPLVDAWLHRHAAGQGPRLPQSDSAIASMTMTGMMDFGPLTSARVLQWLAQNGHWPVGMPQTTSRTALQLSQADVEAARNRLSQDRENARRRDTYVHFESCTYSEDPDDLQALARAVQEQAASETLDTPVEPIGLQSLTETAPTRRHPASGGSGLWRPPAEKTKGIGLVGEMVVGEWLKQQFGLPMEDTWVSGYRTVILGDAGGDDGLGYDFKVNHPSGTSLFEVKATTGNDCHFTLGESEVRRAQNLSPDETYTIVLVNYVLTPAQRQLTPLPNPLSPGGLTRFRLLGSALRLQFEPTRSRLTSD